jgi:HK97 family phage major capsid protein
MPFTHTTSTAQFPWRPDVSTHAPVDVVPESLILQTSTVAGVVEGDAPSVRCAYVVDDEAVFKAEGAELDEAEPELAEVAVFTAKISMLIRVSREQYFQNGTAEQLSQSCGRALVKKADQAYLAQAAPVGPAVSPAAGLLNVTGIVDGGEISDSLDGLVDLVAELQSNNATPSHIVVDPLAWAELRKLKYDTGTSNQSLLGAGTDDSTPRLLSLPVLVNRFAPAHTGLVVDQTAVVSAVGPVMVATSADQYFSSDSIAVRATWRIGQGVPRPDRLGTFTVAATGGS